MSEDDRLSRFVTDGTDITALSVCGFCEHKHLNSRTCDAYPDGIPEPLLRGDIHHNDPLPGDRGIRFKLAEELRGMDKKWLRTKWDIGL